jgi:hypothetical protein
MKSTNARHIPMKKVKKGVRSLSFVLLKRLLTPFFPDVASQPLAPLCAPSQIPPAVAYRESGVHLLIPLSRAA